MNLVAKAVDKIANPPRMGDPDRLRAVVSGKTVLVTGASYGLGEATARKLGAAGATVLLVARSADRLAALAASINAGGGRAAAYPADLCDETAVAALAERLTENHGPMDVVVSNAGKSIRRSLHLQYDRPQDFERTIGVNYLGPVRLLLGLLPAMRRRGSGHIISFDDRCAHRTRPALGHLPGVQERVRRVVAQRGTGTARRRRACHLGVYDVGAHPHERSHADPAQNAGPVCGAGRRHRRQGDHRPARQGAAVVGVADRNQLGAAARAVGGRDGADISVLHRFPKRSGD